MTEELRCSECGKSVCTKFTRYKELAFCDACLLAALRNPAILDYKPLGLDWSNDALFYTHKYIEETSAFDPEGSWSGNCHTREYKCRIPLAFKHCEELIEWFIELMYDHYPEEKGFWID